MRGIRTISVAILLGCFGAAAASAQEDLEGGKDHPLISRYPGSRITAYAQKDYEEYHLPLGGIQSGKPEKSQSLEGKITHILYENPQGRSVLEIYRNYEGALRTAGFQFLFSCASVAQCGSGYFEGLPGRQEWWNDGNPVRHLSAKLSRQEGDVYVSLHVQEGQYGTWLDVIEMKPMQAGLVTVDATALAGDLGTAGHVAVYGIYFDTGKAEVKPESEAALKEIAKLLQQNPQLKLHIVGHTDSVGDLSANMDLSRRRGAAVVQMLAAKYGIAATRLHPEGVGPLAPVGSNKTEEGRAKNRRVELVEQ